MKKVSNNSNAQSTAKQVFNPSSVKVERVKWWDDKTANFNLILDDTIIIYNMRYYDAGKGGFISFPQTKGKDGNYWNVVYVPLAEEVRKAIAETVEKQN